MIFTLRTIGPSLLLAAALLSGGTAAAHDPEAMHEHRPYGGYCRGPRWGWYGAHMPVRTEADARKHLEAFFKDEPVTIGTITQPRGRFFQADILDRNGNVVDRVIIDRRSGRIRSIF